MGSAATTGNTSAESGPAGDGLGVAEVTGLAVGAMLADDGGAPGGAAVLTGDCVLVDGRAAVGGLTGVAVASGCTGPIDIDGSADRLVGDGTLAAHPATSTTTTATNHPYRAVALVAGS
jgi:hypothetical protein